MRIDAWSPSRAGLAGNPSDGYGGRVVAVAIGDFGAWAAIHEEHGVCLQSSRDGALSFSSPDEALDRSAAGGRHALALAACRRFFAEALARGWTARVPGPGEGFHLSYGCDIPERVGLAGSSALAVAILRALAGRYGVAFPDADLACVALQVETREMGIHAGLMDRVAQVLGGLLYMDLSSDLVADTGRGRYERLPVENLPPLFLAWDPRLAAGSDAVHNTLLERFRRGDPQVLAVMRDLAQLADEARSRLCGPRRSDLSDVLDGTFDLRCRLLDVGDGNRRLVETGRRLGAGLNQAGSGGAVVGAYDGDADRLRALKTAYEEIGARFLVPRVAPVPTGGSTDA